MHVIKVNAIDSTNSYLRKMCNNEVVSDYTVAMANEQTKGRGQMGTVWDSENGKNLMFSVFKELKSLTIDDAFYVGMIISLSICDALRELGFTSLKIKWPNDILSENKKICGILIENVIKKNQLNSCIIGIGLNVNQTEFKNLPNASSLKLSTGMHYDLDELLSRIMNQLKQYFIRVNSGDLSNLKHEYEEQLFRKNKPSTFKDVEGNMFTGFIKGVSKSGKLKILLEDEVIQKFDLKEITLLY